MSKQKQKDSGNKQSAGGGTSNIEPDKKSGKEAASHTKAGESKGAGGGKKRARKH